MKFNKKEMYPLLTDALIIMIAVVISGILLIQYNSATDATIIRYEERYIRPIDPQTDIIRGNPEADIFIVEYGDLECPYCRDFHPHAKKIITSHWGKSGKVAWVWRNGFHVNDTSREKAETLECVKRHAGENPRQKIWGFIEASLFGGVEEFEYPFDRYKKIMDDLDIPFERVQTCRRNNEVAKEIRAALRDIRELDIRKTPYIQFLSQNNELLYEDTGAISAGKIESIISYIFQQNRSQ